MRIALLDVNVLLALAWPNHQFHAEAHAWFHTNARSGWASCAFTQLGFIRLSANPAYAPNAVTPREAALLLENWIRHKAHHFWTSPAATDPGIYVHALGHQQVNDAWLVHVTRRNKGRLVTFDSRLTVHAAGKVDVEVIS